MLFPNKLFTYSESVISKFPIVLDKLKNRSIGVADLYMEISDEVSGINEFMDVLDCLYALNAIYYDKDREVIVYAIAN